MTKRTCSFFTPCREEREEEEQQKLKEQHDIPASSLQSPGKALVQMNYISRFARGVQIHQGVLLVGWDLLVALTFLGMNDSITSHVEK